MPGACQSKANLTQAKPTPLHPNKAAPEANPTQPNPKPELTAGIPVPEGAEGAPDETQLSSHDGCNVGDITGIHEDPSAGAAEGTMVGPTDPGAATTGCMEGDKYDDGESVGSPGAAVGAGVGMSSIVHSRRGSAMLYWEPR